MVMGVNPEEWERSIVVHFKANYRPRNESASQYSKTAALVTTKLNLPGNKIITLCADK
jgi:hypothetical protein